MNNNKKPDENKTIKYHEKQQKGIEYPMRNIKHRL